MFLRLGENWNVDETLQCELEKFTCLHYYSNTKVTSVNDLRYQLYCAKKGDVESSQLPPCRDCLRKHILRANYQYAIWRRSLKNVCNAPSPVGMGWVLEKIDGEERFNIDWMSGAPAPKAVLELLACDCRTCNIRNCTCMQNKLKCTELCRSSSCINQAQNMDEEVFDPMADEEISENEIDMSDLSESSSDKD